MTRCVSPAVFVLISPWLLYKSACRHVHPAHLQLEVSHPVNLSLPLSLFLFSFVVNVQLNCQQSVDKIIILFAFLQIYITDLCLCVSSWKHGLMAHGYVHVLTPEPSLVYLPVLRSILTCEYERSMPLRESSVTSPS